MTNQKKVLLKKVSKGGLGDSKSLTIFKTKTTEVMKSLGIPLSLYAATEYDEYRKPRTKIWKTILDDYDLDVEGTLDLEGSIFVGDAAGRPGDHSCVDRYESRMPTQLRGRANLDGVAILRKTLDCDSTHQKSSFAGNRRSQSSALILEHFLKMERV